MSEPLRRARWLPVVLWAALAWSTASLLSDTTPTGMLLPLMPLLFALAGGGLSRLLPTLAASSPARRAATPWRFWPSWHWSGCTSAWNRRPPNRRQYVSSD